jgi:protoporphyrinogen/coproporphyrinogen III oxidase
VAVVGGGITGLAAAHALLAQAPGRRVVLLEATDRLGGTIATEHAGGFVIETGADAFLTEKPWALALCERLGMAQQLTGTREGDRRTYVVHTGRLVPLPEGFMLLAPTDLGALAASPLFSWRGKLRMALDLVLPRRPGDDDESLGAFVRRRFGREALEHVAEPLLGGIYTGDVEQLSLAATMPRFRELERRHRSLILGLRATSATRAAGARYSLFATPADGMGALITALARRLPEGVVRLRTPVAAMTRESEGWRLLVGGASLTASVVVVAAPAHTASPLLAPLDAGLGRLLGAIEHASSATVSLGYRAADVPALRGLGFVVPARERRALLACTYSSRKFAGRAPEGCELLRVFVGGVRRPELAALENDALVATVRGELRELLGITAPPLLTRIRQHVHAMPQYGVGHLERVAEIEGRAAGMPGLLLAGAAYRGVGIPDCVRSGEAAAEAALRHLGSV